MDELRLKKEQALNRGDAGDCTSSTDIELDARKQLELAKNDIHRVKTNLESVLEDNYIRQEEILRLNQLLKQTEAAGKQDVQKLKQDYECQICEHKKKIEEFERKITELLAELKAGKRSVTSQPFQEKTLLTELNSIQQERNSLRLINEKFVRLISEFVKLGNVLERRTNCQVSPSSPLTSSALHLSPVSGHSTKWTLSDCSVDGRSSAASTTDEGVEVSRCLSESGFFATSEIDMECEEAAKEANVSIRRSFQLLLDELQLCESRLKEAQHGSKADDSTLESTTLESTPRIRASLENLHEIGDDKELMEIKLHRQKSLVSSLKSQLEEQKKTIEELRNDTANVAHWKEVMEIEREMNAAKDDQIAALGDRILDLQKQNAACHVELEKLRKESETSRRKQTETEIQLDEKHKLEVLKMTETVREKEKCIENLKKQLDSKQNELNVLTESNKQLKLRCDVETSRVQKQLEETQRVVEIQTDKMSSLQDQLDKKNAKIQQLTEELDSSEEDLAKLRQSFGKEKRELSGMAQKRDDEFFSLNSQLNQEKETNLEKTNQLEALERKMNALSKDLDESRLQEQHLQHQIEKLEADGEILSCRLNESGAEIVRTKQASDADKTEMEMERRHLLQKIEEMKRHHRKEIEDLLEDKEKHSELLHGKDFADGLQAKKMQSESLLSKKFENLSTEKELQVVNKSDLEKKVKRQHQLEIESIRTQLKKEFDGKIEIMVKDKEKELIVLHKKELENVNRSQQKELETIQSKLLDDLNDLENSLVSRNQQQLKKLKDKHDEEMFEMLEEKEAEMNAVKEKHDRETKKLRQELESGKNEAEENVKTLTSKYHQSQSEFESLRKQHEVEVQTTQKEMRKLQEVNKELMTRISKVERQRVDDLNEIEGKPLNNQKKVKSATESHGQQEIENLKTKYEQIISDMESELLRYRKQIQELEKRLFESQKHREQESRGANKLKEEEKMRLRTTYEKEFEDRLEVIVLNHQQEIRNIKHELASAKSAVKEFQKTHESDLREKTKLIEEAKMSHNQTRILMDADSQDQFNRLAEKYQEKFSALEEELEKKNLLIEEMQHVYLRKIEELNMEKDKAALDDLQEREALMESLRRENEERENRLKSQVRRLEDETAKVRRSMNDQKKEFVEEGLRWKEDMKKLVSKHSSEVKDMKKLHQHYLCEAEEEYRREMENLREKLCRTRDLIKDLKIEHMRELAQATELSRSQHFGKENGLSIDFGGDDVNLSFADVSGIENDAWLLEKRCLVAEVEAFQRLIKDIAGDFEEKEDFSWRTEILRAMHEVLTKQLKRAETEIFWPSIAVDNHESVISFIASKIDAQEQLYIRGLEYISGVDRHSLLTEIDVLRHQIGGLQKRRLDDNESLSNKLLGLEARFRKKIMRLKNKLNEASQKLSQEQKIRFNLEMKVEAEKMLNQELLNQLSKENASVDRLKLRTEPVESEFRSSDAVPDVATSNCSQIAKNQKENHRPVDWLEYQELSQRLNRAEEHRASLAYQKRYLMLLLGGFVDCEEETLDSLVQMGAWPTVRRRRSQFLWPLLRFRRIVQAVIALVRLKHLRRGRNSAGFLNFEATNSVLPKKRGFATSKRDDALYLQQGKSHTLSQRSRPRLRRSRTPDIPRAAVVAVGDGVMSHSCDCGKERLRLSYSHQQPGFSKSNERRLCRVDMDHCNWSRRRGHSADHTRRRQLPLRPASACL